MSPFNLTTKKWFIYLGWGLFIIAFAGLLFALRPNNTVDFRGTVDEITFNDESSYTYIQATMVFGTNPRTIRVGSNISVSNSLDGSRMQAADIKAGDMIDLDVRGNWDEPTAIIIPRWIRVFPSG
jgi:hypothetical protein